jgi:hypothetical protein
MQTGITIELVSVYCDDTEDLTGADEFYLIGLAVGDPDLKSPILTTPRSVNDGELKSFGAESILFKGEVPVDSNVALYLQARDEDVAKDWSQRPAWVDKMSEAAAAKLGAGAAAALLTNPAGWATVGICALAAVGIGGFYLAMGSDQDDELGSLQVLIPARGPAEETRRWRFAQSGWYSGWNYTLTYRVRRVGAGVIPPLVQPSPPRPEPRPVPLPPRRPGQPQPAIP